VLVGWWLAALPAGLIAGDLLGVWCLTPQRQRRLVGLAAAASFVPYLAFFATPPIAVALPLLAGAGMGSMYSLGLDSLVRRAAPEHLFARTMAVSTAGLLTTQALGFALAGAVAGLAGPGRTIAGAGLSGIPGCPGRSGQGLSMGRTSPVLALLSGSQPAPAQWLQVSFMLAG
jgi:hypothetical protein